MPKPTASNAISKTQNTPSPALRVGDRVAVLSQQHRPLSPLTGRGGIFETGFTLVEIMLALVVFSFVALGMAYGMSATIRDSGDGQYRQDIVLRAQNHLNSTDWATLCPAVNGTVAATISLSNGSSQALSIACTQVTLGGQDLQTVAATASWSERGITRNVTVSR